MPTILLADDNSNIHKMVTLALKDLGVRIVAVGNGQAAVRKLSELQPDLILADIFMPVRNGYELCEYVKRDVCLRSIPVVLLAGAFDPFDEREAQRVSADGVLKKPFVPPDPLVAMVKSLLLGKIGLAGGAPSTKIVAQAETPEPPTCPTAMKDPAALEMTPFAPAAEEQNVEAESMREETPSEPVVFGEEANRVVFSRLSAAPEEETAAGLPVDDSLTGDGIHTWEHSPSVETFLSGAVIEAPEGMRHWEEKQSPLVPSDEVNNLGGANGHEATAETTVEASVKNLGATTLEPSGSSSVSTDLPDRELDAQEEAHGTSEMLAENVGESEAAHWAESESGFASFEGEMSQSGLAPTVETSSPPPELETFENAAAKQTDLPPQNVQSFGVPVPSHADLVEEVVSRVVERMQPQVMEIVTREILRPLVEAIARRELQKPSNSV